MYSKTKIHNALYAWLLLGLFYITSLVMLWPGIMSPDANSQYSAAMAGIYTDHHPPMMSFLWHYLAKIYPGPAPMFIFHLSLLYAAAAIFIYIFRNSKFKWWYAIYPLIPNLLAYTALIVKDTGFTYTYLLAGAIMALLIINHTKQHKALLLLLILALLFYGTAVKFQAKYLLIFFTIGVGYCWFNYQLNWRAFGSGVVIYLAIFAGIAAVNAKLVPSAQESHSWQLVKIYDLSAISIALDRPLYPEFILQQPNFNFSLVKERFMPREVDPLVFYENPVIRAGSTAEQRDALWHYWFKTVTQHPWLYLSNRFTLFSYDLTTSPCERNNPVKFLQNTALAPILQLPGVSSTVDLGYTIFKSILRFIWLLPLLFLYCYLGIVKFNKTRAAAPLLMFNITSLALLIVLLFCSMAGTARYVFLCTCLVHASHGFAYCTYKNKRI